MAFDGTKTQVTLFNCLFNWVSDRWLARKNPSVLWWQMCAQACCSILLRPTAECSRITCVFGWAFDFHIYVEYFFCCNSINANKYLSTRECVRVRATKKPCKLPGTHLLVIFGFTFGRVQWEFSGTRFFLLSRIAFFPNSIEYMENINWIHKILAKKCVPFKWICMV